MSYLNGSTWCNQAFHSVLWTLLVSLEFNALSFILYSRSGKAAVTVDMANLDTRKVDSLMRVHGRSIGLGNLGVPVAGGKDADGDGHADYAVGYFRASPFGRRGAGEVNLVFGNGVISGTVDTAEIQPRILRIAGDSTQEATGNEIWLDDVTGDGLADLLIARQNFTSSASLVGAGALTIISGSSELRDFASQLRFMDLRQPPDFLKVLTIFGKNAFDRLGIWVRTGDVDGDGIADIAVGADQEDTPEATNSGAVYVIRGGPHLSISQTVSLSDSSSVLLAGNLARLRPPTDSKRFHLGGTCQIADLDGNGRGEVLAAATINRSGATVTPEGAPHGVSEAASGSPGGTLYIAWDDNFPAAPWPAGFEFDISNPPVSKTIIYGGTRNVSLGEEIVGGGDFDNDGRPDLFVGDLAANSIEGRERFQSGAGYLFFDASLLKNLASDLDSLPENIRLTTIIGPSRSAIGGDTATLGDFDGDGITDLTFCSPLASPLGRDQAGSIHIFYGQDGEWPYFIDTAPGSLPAEDEVRVSEIFGAHGSVAEEDRGDVLCYSAASGDINGDGIEDLITNEMMGNGLAAGAKDAGNLIILSGLAVSTRAPLRFPQFGNGGGLTSELVLTNMSSRESTNVELRFFADDGSVLFHGTLILRASGGRIAAVVLEMGNRLGDFTILPVFPLFD